ncbi:MAG: hypothetical protein IJ398_04055 [Clostridia bacterium]|nr:hypothetical protein [Clostridia bacterium]
MVKNPFDNFMANMDDMVREHDKAIKRIFSGHIKGNFLIEMKHLVQTKYLDVYKYYKWDFSTETIVKGSDNTLDFDVSRTIVGCHSSNIIFMDDSERVTLEKDDKYKNALAEQVIQNIRLRQYGSQFFRTNPILRGELFLAYNIPYDTFVMSVRTLEMINQNRKPNALMYYRSLIAKKALAALTLLEDGFLENCYPICRTAMELYIKLLLFMDYPNLVDEHQKFSHFEVIQSCCEQDYPDDFNELYKNRLCKGKTKKIDYLHYGWVDSIPNYHSVVTYQPYSINGLLNYLRLTHIDEEQDYFISLEYFYKMCHGYAHGNVNHSKYPLLHYFEISIMLHRVVSHMYSNMCQELEVDTVINGIDILEKAEKDYNVLIEQYNKRSTELFERHYQNRR